MKDALQERLATLEAEFEAKKLPIRERYYSAIKPHQDAYNEAMAKLGDARRAKIGVHADEYNREMRELEAWYLAAMNVARSP